jgi:hypothetical protein
MKKSTTYWVSPDGESRWLVKREGEDDAISYPPTRRAAIAFARRLAWRDQPSQLVIQRRDGTTESEPVYRDDLHPER